MFSSTMVTVIPASELEASRYGKFTGGFEDGEPDIETTLQEMLFSMGCSQELMLGVRRISTPQHGL